VTLALVAVQLEVDDDIVRSPDIYRAQIERAAAAAIDAAGPADQKLVVFPELAGHLALLALAPPSAKRAKTLPAALAAAAVRRPLEVLRGIATTRLLDHRHAVLAALAPDGERFWRGVFGPLARRHGVHVVAGSHLRLGPNGDLTNASFLFAPDGRLLATTDKVNLVPGIEDRSPKGLALARGLPERVPIVDAAFGRVCTLLSYDAFREPHTPQERFDLMPARIAARGGVRVVANPSANLWPWHGPWRFAEAGDPQEPASREAQWHREGLAGALAETPFARWGVTAHLVGHVLELAFEGQSEILECTTDGGLAVRRLARAPHHDRGTHVVATVT
jgi:predicted amidohydrolase